MTRRVHHVALISNPNTCEDGDKQSSCASLIGGKRRGILRQPFARIS
jgi:hypothetical protein